VLARIIEAAGLSTVLVTNMPFWAEKTGTPRTLAVEFPFGHALGQPQNVAQQMRVIEQALEVLETTQEPGTIVHSPETWPVPVEQAMADWQPQEPSPVVALLKTRFLEMMRQQRRRGRGGSRTLS
jgi:hypothetical protein